MEEKTKRYKIKAYFFLLPYVTCIFIFSHLNLRLIEFNNLFTLYFNTFLHISFIIIKKIKDGFTMNKTEIIGNITTIGKIIAMAIAGWFIGYCVSKGINLPVDQETLSEIIFTIFLLIWSYFDAKYQNTLFGKTTPVVETEEPVLNDEYECDKDDGC